MTAFVLLLRGVNVGGHGKLPMADLRRLLAGLDAGDVATYIQSGNAVFTGAMGADTFAARVEDAIEAGHGFRPRALVIQADTFARIVEAYPWREAKAEPKTGHIWFLATPPGPGAEAALAPLAAASERVALTDKAAYLHAPDGIGRSKLAARLEQAVGVPATARNLKTALTLADMARAAGRAA